MDIFDVLSLIGGLCLFLFGMNLMGQALERRAGNKLKVLLGKLTGNKISGLLTGLGVTSIIQSSSATTVMVVGFVNSGLMTLRQAINVIMGANIGTTVTAWILSLGGIDSGNLFLKLLKPTSFTPVLALIGIVLYMFYKDNKKQDTGMILLGFATLMFGMDTMTSAVSGLADVPEFQNLFILFKNPILGMIVGAVLTAIIQSSSASVGILQALAITGQVSYGAAIPIIMGQNIGTCITAILSSFGTNKNAKRAALVHLSFNVIGTLVWISIFCIVDAIISPVLFDSAATLAGIAIAHSAFNILCTILMLPMSSLLEKLAYKIVPDTKTPDTFAELDELLLTAPTIALERCNSLTIDMAKCAIDALKEGLSCIKEYSQDIVVSINEKEDRVDRLEDVIGNYLVKLSTHKVNKDISSKSADILKMIGDLERISDHAVDLAESAQEMKDKDIVFSDSAFNEFSALCDAITEVLDLTYKAMLNNDLDSAFLVGPLEDVIDVMKEEMRTRHILRMQKSLCSIEAGFVWADLLTNLERTSDHCTNIAESVISSNRHNISNDQYVRILRTEGKFFKEKYDEYSNKYLSRVRLSD